MTAFLVVVVQMVLAVLAAGLVMPALLFSVPATQTRGPLAMALLVAVMFTLLRAAWPRRRA